MIDPRQSPVAMLPILNAVAGHMIAAAAPLRRINVEDTEQMVAEAADAGGFDVDAMDLAAHHELAGIDSFEVETSGLAGKACSIGGNLGNYLSTLQATIAESV